MSMYNFYVTDLHMQENSPQHSAVGQWLGWMMAAIYMGGRIPQILWNVSHSFFKQDHIFG